MKKAKKLLALISSAVMIASIGAMSVSAGIAGEKYYDSTYTSRSLAGSRRAKCPSAPYRNAFSGSDRWPLSCRSERCQG